MVKVWIDLATVIGCYTDLVKFAMPIVFVFGMGNVLFDMFTSAAFGGVMKIGGRVR